MLVVVVRVLVMVIVERRYDGDDGHHGRFVGNNGYGDVGVGDKSTSGSSNGGAVMRRL